ncbi:MAG TPA: cytochrome c family protein [Caulobacteraceae bacterium]
MRVFATVMISAFALLTACSQASPPPGGAANDVSAESEAPAAAPPVLTPTQKKAMLAELPIAYQSADLDNGQAKFAICKTCHNVTQGGGNMTGPNLWGVFGRKAGSEAGFAYSDGMKALGSTWDADKIDKWIANPRAVVSATKMTYIGMENPKDRIDLIAYLKTVTSAPPTS